MTGRDRLVVMGLVVLVVIAGGWLLLVSPERKQAAQAGAKVASAHQELSSAQEQAAGARSAQARYLEAYKSIVSLGKAVPPLEEVPSLIYELDQASNQRDIEFNSISNGTSAGTGGGGASASAASAAPSVFTPMPFTFIFKGSYFGLEHFLAQIDGFAKATPASTAGSASSTATAADITGVQVSGRLLTIQGVALTMEGQSAVGARQAKTGKSDAAATTQPGLSATITATAYVLPASQGLTAGATPTGPAGTGAGASASSTTASSSPSTPAVIRVTP
jgi:Type II secretion system (T2SS), protein M